MLVNGLAGKQQCWIGRGIMIITENSSHTPPALPKAYSVALVWKTKRLKTFSVHLNKQCCIDILILHIYKSEFWLYFDFSCVIFRSFILMYICFSLCNSVKLEKSGTQPKVAVMFVEQKYSFSHFLCICLKQASFLVFLPVTSMIC